MRLWKGLLRTCEVESLANKHEEKYKQSGDVASKLTIEESTFRDIQAKKMDMCRAIVKMGQDGKADGVQVTTDQIQSELEELVKSLNERCKSYGLRAKPTTLVELPFGWQPGIQEGAADWDKNWDKFEDEGFTFVKELTLNVQNVIAPPKPKSSSIVRKTSSAKEGVDSSTNGDHQSEALSSRGERVPGDAHNEEGVARSPPESPAQCYLERGSLWYGNVVQERNTTYPAERDYVSERYIITFRIANHLRLGSCDPDRNSLGVVRIVVTLVHLMLRRAHLTSPKFLRLERTLMQMVHPMS